MRRIATILAPFDQIQRTNFWDVKRVNSGYHIPLTDEDNEMGQGWLVMWTNVMFMDCQHCEPIPMSLGLHMPEIVDLMGIEETGRTGENTNILFCREPIQIMHSGKKEQRMVLCDSSDATHIITVNAMKGHGLVMCPDCSVWHGFKTLESDDSPHDCSIICYDLLPMEAICDHNRREIVQIADSYFDYLRVS